MRSLSPFLVLPCTYVGVSYLNETGKTLAYFRRGKTCAISGTVEKDSELVKYELRPFVSQVQMQQYMSDVAFYSRLSVLYFGYGCEDFTGNQSY